MVHRCAAPQHTIIRGNFGHFFAFVVHPQDGFVDHFTNFGVIDFPFLANGFHLLFVALLDHRQHAFLGFRKHDFVSIHIRFPQRHVVQVNDHATVALGTHFRGRAGNACRTHILNAHQNVPVNHFQGGFQEQLFGERVTHLHIGPFGFGIFGKLLRSKRRTVDAIPAGAGTKNVHRISRPFGNGRGGFIMPNNTHRHGIDQWIGRIGIFKINFPRDGWHPQAVAVIGNAPHYAVKQIPVTGMG